MRFNSITFKLSAFIIGIASIVAIFVFVFIDHQLKQILNKSQVSMYTERVDAIVDVLARKNERLKKTGLVEVYIDDFQYSTLSLLRVNQYNQSDQNIYPFIIRSNGLVVMHPKLQPLDASVKDTSIVAKMLSSDQGAFYDTYLGEKKWYVYKRFDEWGWVVGYTVPLDIKYKDAREFRNKLILLFVVIALPSLFGFILIVTRFTRPIINLTEASKRIAGGDLGQQIDLSGNDEVGKLSRNFEFMRAAIKDKIAVMNHEIGERKRAEEETKQLRNYLSNIINSMPSMLMGVDKDGIITQWNLEAHRLTGLSTEEVLGQPLNKAIPEITIGTEQVTSAIESRKELTRPKRTRQKDGKTIYEDITIYPLITNGVEGAVIRIDDVTERVRMEEMMIQSEKMLSVGGLAAGMAHEINNPLAGMMQTANVMSSRLKADSPIPANLTAAEAAGTNMEAINRFMEDRGILRMVSNIIVSGERVATIVNNMLSFARKGDATRSSYDVKKILDKTLDLASTDYDLKKKYDFKAITIIKQYAENLPPVPCQSAKIQQVLLNIFSNGAQAMTMSSTEHPQFVIRTYLEQNRQMACIEIKDSGPGMDEETRKRVFEPFFSTKQVGEGTGLGLSVSYFIVTENHGGEMEVESRLGSGSTFTIRLPMRNGPAKPNSHEQI